MIIIFLIIMLDCEFSIFFAFYRYGDGLLGEVEGLLGEVEGSGRGIGQSRLR